LSTPRLDVLAELTELGPDPPEAPCAVTVVEVAEVLDGAWATQSTSPTTTTPTSTNVRIWVERGRRTKWPHDRPILANGFQLDGPLIGHRGAQT
jgi:hypothetical protein